MSTTAAVRQQRARALGARVPGLLDDAGRVWSLNMGPEQGQLTGNAFTFSTQPLQGLKPLTYANGPGLRGLSFSHDLSHSGPVLRQLLANLRSCASSAHRVRFINMSQQEASGWWHITDLSIQITRRDTDQEAVQARLSWTFVEAVTATVPKIGKTAPRNSGPGAAAAHSSGGSKPASPPSTAIRRYTVKAGDGLYAIAGTLLGSYARWREIASLNHITDPNRLTVGQVLKIPAR